MLHFFSKIGPSCKSWMKKNKKKSLQKTFLADKLIFFSGIMSMHLSFLKNTHLKHFYEFKLWKINRNRTFFFGGTKKTVFILLSEFFRTLFLHTCEEFNSINGEKPILTSFWSITSYRGRILIKCFKIRIPHVQRFY